MTKKDYELIASALNEARGSVHNADQTVIHTVIAHKLAQKLSLTNPRFKPDKFLKACGVQ